MNKLHRRRDLASDRANRTLDGGIASLRDAIALGSLQVLHPAGGECSGQRHVGRKFDCGVLTTR